MSLARSELAYAKIVEEFAAIKTADGYRTDPFVTTVIRESSKMQGECEIGIEMGAIEVEIEGWTDNAGQLEAVVNELIPVYVVGTVKSDTDTDGKGTKLKAALDALTHDVRRVGVVLYTKYINETVAPGAWNIVTSSDRPKIKVEQALGLGKNFNVGKCQLTFTIKIRNEDQTFSA